MSDEQAIRDLVATWMESTKSGDLDTMLGLMTEDVVFLVPGRPPMVGREAFAAAARSQRDAEQPRFEGTSEIREIEVQGDVAWMWTRLRVVASFPDGSTTTRSGHTLSILKKVDGRWLLARDANLLAPEE